MIDAQRNDLRAVMAAAVKRSGRSKAAIGRAMSAGGSHRTTPLPWIGGNDTAAPNVASLVRFGAAVGVPASELLRRAGL